jgi:hypothetical protein
MAAEYAVIVVPPPPEHDATEQIPPTVPPTHCSRIETYTAVGQNADLAVGFDLLHTQQAASRGIFIAPHEVKCFEAVAGMAQVNGQRVEGRSTSGDSPFVCQP